VKYCHIIGQIYPHDDVELILTTEALEELQRAINEALVRHDNKEVKTAYLFCTDGEGFTISINKITPEEDMLKFKPPYKDLYSIFQDDE
jgi:hypothetical protein